jgi:cytochrome c oxidase cbb3-type subunit 3
MTGFWKKVKTMSDPNKATKNVIFKDEEALLLDHDYDGIQELDHPLPSWWLAIFWGAIGFAVLYGIYFHGMDGGSLAQEYADQMKMVKAAQPVQAPGGGLTEEQLLAAFKDPAKAAAGKETFEKNCASCHGHNGEGLIGPNLTDDYWIHGQGSPSDLVTVITNGVPEKGMPTWGPVLKADEIVTTGAFIRSLHGTTPANAKEPQGNQVEFKEL